MFSVGPSLTVQNAALILAQGESALHCGETEFNLAPLQSVDSCAVAVLLAWCRIAQKQGSSLRFLSMRQNLCSLADLYGVEPMLPRPA